MSISLPSGSAAGADTLKLWVHCGLECTSKIDRGNHPSVPKAPIINLCKSYRDVLHHFAAV